MDGSLGRMCKVDLGHHPDNLTWGDQDPDTLYIAAHSSMLASALHLILGTPAGSRVLAVDTTAMEFPPPSDDASTGDDVTDCGIREDRTAVREALAETLLTDEPRLRGHWDRLPDQSSDGYEAARAEFDAAVRFLTLAQA